MSAEAPLTEAIEVLAAKARETGQAQGLILLVDAQGRDCNATISMPDECLRTGEAQTSAVIDRYIMPAVSCLRQAFREDPDLGGIVRSGGRSSPKGTEDL